VSNKKKNEPTAEEIMDALSPPARRCLRTMAGKPDDAAGWYNRLADVRAALKVGAEVMEGSAREEAKANGGKPTATGNMKFAAAGYALGTVTAIECCMSIIEKLHPSLTIKVKSSDDQPSPYGSNGHTLPGDGKIRRLDLD
jgi:hypothetical protein